MYRTAHSVLTVPVLPSENKVTSPKGSARQAYASDRDSRAEQDKACTCCITCATCQDQNKPVLTAGRHCWVSMRMSCQCAAAKVELASIRRCRLRCVGLPRIGAWMSTDGFQEGACTSILSIAHQALAKVF